MKYGEAWASSSTASTTPALENATEAVHIGAGPIAEMALDSCLSNWENAWIDIGGEG
jgi:hypothetical protein